MKNSYNCIKQYIEEFGYQLVSREYKNAHVKLEFICPKGHFFEMTYNNFRNGQRCPTCSGKQKHSYEHVKQHIEGFGYQLVSTEYRNNKTKMDLVCPKGHSFKMRYDCFQRGVRCPTCSGKQKYSYIHVKQYIEGFGYTLVSKEYKNSCTKMEMVCPKDHFFEMSYGSFRQGHRCPVCYGNKKHSYNQIKQYIEGFGYQLVSNGYKNSKTKMDLVCPKGHSFKMHYNSFHTGCRCPKCFGTPKYSYNHVKQHIEEFGYNLVSKEYINNHTKLKMICSKDHFFEMSYNNFQTGYRCPKCSFENKALSYDQVKEYIEGFGYQLVSNGYKNSKTKLEMVCPKGHSFKMHYSGFHRGKRCPECAKYLTTSRGEKEVLNFVQSIYDGRIIENDRTQIINPLTGKYLELDIFLPELNKAIEYNGIYWHNGDYVKYKDSQKQLQCSEKGIELLTVEEEKWINYKTLLMQQLGNFIENGNTDNR